MKDQTTIGTRKHREWSENQKSVQLKEQPVTRLNAGCGKNGGSEVWDEFNISFNDERLDYRLSMTRHEAQRVVNHFCKNGELMPETFAPNFYEFRIKVKAGLNWEVIKPMAMQCDTREDAVKVANELSTLTGCEVRWNQCGSHQGQYVKNVTV